MNYLMLRMRWIFFVSLLFMGATFFGCASSVSLLPLHEKGVLTQQVREIFARLEQPVNTLEEANNFAQATLLRRGERWDEQVSTLLQQTMIEHRSFIIDRLRLLGMIEEIVPQHREYTYALLLGSTTQNLKERLAYLKKLCDAKYEFTYIALLGGVRPLRDEEKTGLPDEIQTEAQMMEYVYAQAGFDEHKKLLINSQMIQKEDGTLMRPTTDTTIIDFMKEAPCDGSCLVISSNPFILRQKKVAERILDATRFPVDAAGAGVVADKFPPEAIVILMDEFARLMYEDCVAFKKASEVAQ